MKKLKVKKGSTCMACLACVEACSEAFYKVFDPDKACLQITEKKTGSSDRLPTVRKMCGGMSGRRHHTECKGRIRDQQEKMYRLWCLRRRHVPFGLIVKAEEFSTPASEMSLRLPVYCAKACPMDVLEVVEE